MEIFDLVVIERIEEVLSCDLVISEFCKWVFLYFVVLVFEVGFEVVIEIEDSEMLMDCDIV